MSVNNQLRPVSSSPSDDAAAALSDRREGSIVRTRRSGTVWWRTQPGQLVVLSLVSALLGLACLVAPLLVPFTSFVLVCMIGGFFLRVRSLLVLYLMVGSVAAFVAVNRSHAPTVGQFIIIAVTAGLMLLYARSREELGVQGSIGDSMLVDLRDRLVTQGQVPELPEHWHVDAQVSPAYGDSFSGDFVVASQPEKHTLEVCLVDVSGKGQAAGTRSLLLSGAFGGLLGAMNPQHFLPAANAYLLQQNWDEGFATAVHLFVDFETGYYRIAGAGHPPAVHYHAGSGQWQVLEGYTGPALGILDGMDYDSYEGELLPGDALFMYTDGLVEKPDGELDLGVDRLIGQSEKQLAHGGFEGAAHRIVEGVDVGESDDRALLIVWREASPTTAH